MVYSGHLIIAEIFILWFHCIYLNIIPLTLQSVTTLSESTSAKPLFFLSTVGSRYFSNSASLTYTLSTFCSSAVTRSFKNSFDFRTSARRLFIIVDGFLSFSIQIGFSCWRFIFFCSRCFDSRTFSRREVRICFAFEADLFSVGVTTSSAFVLMIWKILMKFIKLRKSKNCRMRKLQKSLFLKHFHSSLKHIRQNVIYYSRASH